MNRTDEGGAPGGRERLFRGHAVCGGIAVGPAYTTHEHEPDAAGGAIRAEQVEDELGRLERATERSLAQLAKLRARLTLLPDESEREIAPLIDAYRQMLSSSRLLRAIQRRVTEGLVSAELAVTEETKLAAKRLLALPDEDGGSLLRRAGEVEEIGRRLIRNLAEAPFRALGNLPRGAILIADRLRPSDVALLDPTRVVGVATDEGGSTDHTAIMLCALGIPAVIGVGGIADAARDGQMVVLDGDAGTITFEPSPQTKAEARKGVARHASERQRLAKLRRLPAELASGEAIELQSNLELPAELPLVVRSGASGIGLLRSEFLFIAAEELPDEAAQATAYAAIIKTMAGDMTTIRLLDWGGEKESTAMRRAGLLPREREANPALGLRGLRLLLAHPELLETQFAAILTASLSGPVRVMLPMLTNIGEFRAAREIYERVGRRLRRRGVKLPPRLPPLGAMVETPGAALMADLFALETDFLSIGSNDLTMYALAVDRASSEVSRLYDPVHPAVLRLIAETTEASLRLRKPISICGEMAGNPKLTPLLLGLGLRSFSMNASAVPRVKQAIRAASLDECVRLARRVLEESDADRIADLLGVNAGQH